MAKVKRSVIRIDNELNQQFSVRLTGEYENGFVGKLGDYEVDNLDVQALLTAANGDSIVIVANPAIVYDNNRLGSGQEDEYVMNSGEVVRAYVPEVNKLISISAEGFDGAVAKDDLVAPDGKKLKKVISAPETGTYFKVVKEDKIGGALAVNTTHGGTTLYVLKTMAV